MSWKFAPLAVVTGLLLFAAQARADGSLSYIDRISDGNGNELDVASYSDPGASPPKIGLFAISNGTRRISVAFSADQWPQFMALWARTQAAQSTSWQDVGQYVESGTTDVSTLKISAGPGTTFLISSPALGVETYLLPSADMARLDAAVRKVQAWITNPSVP